MKTTLITLTAILALTAACQGGNAPMTPKDALLPQMLSPAYQDWVHRPGEMLSFWLWTNPNAMKDQATRTGANAASLHAMMSVRQDDAATTSVQTVPAAEQLGWMGITPGKTLDELGFDAGAGIGEHNNAWFVRYPDWFWKLRPEAAMLDKQGNTIRAGDNPFPATNDALLSRLSREQMADMARALKNEKHLRYWVLGGEQSYPDYFGLPEGDYRPDAVKKFQTWQTRFGKHGEPGENRDDWYAFRESALADYYAGDTAFLRGCDPSRPLLIPTHGNPFARDFRARMGYPVGDLAGYADGFEAGPISIDDDPERLIRLTLDQQTSFGVPVAAPRLANKQLDPSAQGGGRGFSPESLRKTVYEALGMGVWHLGLVQWAGNLPDGEWGIAGTPAEVECKKVFAEINKAAPYLEGCSRLQPQVGIFISDATWRRWWQDRWTLLYDQAIVRGWHVMLLTDVQISPELARVTPVIISVDNPIITQRTRARLSDYEKSGGTVVSVGEFGSDDGYGHKAQSPLAVRIPDDTDVDPVRVIHQTQNPHGAATWSADVNPLPMDALESAISKRADMRPIRLIGPIGRDSAVECLPLTDGTNLIAVLINRSSEATDIRLKLSPRIRAHQDCVQAELSIPESKVLGRWEMIDLVTEKSCKNAQAHLSPWGTALILFRPIVGAEFAASELRGAEWMVGTWKRRGADVSIYEHTLAHVQEHIHEYDGYSSTRMINHGIGMKITVHHIGSAIRMEVKAWIPYDGGPASGANVRVRLVPGTFAWHRLVETAPGVFSLQIADKDLPRFYNSSTGNYELADGMTELIFDASLGTLRGGARATVKLTRDK